jgi:hypothetical protein
MALPITTNTDYTGHLEISTSRSSNLTTYITDLEPKYLKLLTNNNVYSEINSIVGTLPQKYLDLINGVEYTDSSNDLQIFQGIKPLLLRFIYAKYNQDNFQTSIGGNVRSSNENSTVLTAENTSIVIQRYNEAVSLYRDEVVCFLEEYEEISQTVTSLTANGTTSTLNIPSTKYLSDGDTVTIKGVDYIVSNLVEDVSITITVGFDIVLVDDIVKWKPFYDFCPKNIPFSSII